MATNLGINFRISANAQGGKPVRDQVNTASDAFARIIMRDVALRTSDRFYKSNKNKLVSVIEQDVKKEIAQMASMIGRFVIQPEEARGPSGLLSAHAKTASDAGRALGYTKTYSLERFRSSWEERDTKYMRWKKLRSYGTDWWKNTGKLHKFLAKESTYLTAFGPTKVIFTKIPDKKFSESVKMTLAPRQGRASENYTLGRIEVITMGRITPEMLPSLASGDVNDIQPTGKSLASLFPKQQGKKLMGANRDRTVIEPFVSYFLTRAIPNAVFRRTEKAFGRDNADNRAGF